MKKRVMKYLGLFFLVIGFIFILNSFFGITGYAIIEDASKGTSSILGYVFIVIGTVLFLARRRVDYNIVASKVYERLAIRGAYGHHTETIDNLTKWVSGGRITPIDVKGAIESEIKAERLYPDVKSKGRSVSLPLTTNKLEEIIRNYGSNFPKEVQDRFRDLINKKQMEGVR